MTLKCLEAVQFSLEYEDDIVILSQRHQNYIFHSHQSIIPHVLGRINSSR